MVGVERGGGGEKGWWWKGVVVRGAGVGVVT